MRDDGRGSPLNFWDNRRASKLKPCQPARRSGSPQAPDLA
jgi:hypothetical protein